MKKQSQNKFFHLIFGKDSEVILPDQPTTCNVPAATEFQEIIDREKTTRFTRMDRSGYLDWARIAVASQNINDANGPGAIINLLQQGAGYCLGFPVNNLEHCLQTATRAARSGVGDKKILAALLLDAAIPITYHGRAQIAAAILRPYVSEKLYQAVFHHEEFALAYYGDAIGAPTDLHEVYVDQPWYNRAIQLAEWSQASYDPSYNSYSLDHFKDLIEDVFTEHDPDSMELTMSDCFVEEPNF